MLQTNNNGNKKEEEKEKDDLIHEEMPQVYFVQNTLWAVLLHGLKF